MAIVSTIKDAWRSWFGTDPYHYECTVCDRSFQRERATCPDCGGDVERVSGATDGVGGDVHP
jgi:rRNA maturation endonuclease Nob1